MADVRERAVAKVADIEEKIRTLKSMKRALVGLTATCCGDGRRATAPYWRVLVQKGGSNNERKED